MKPMARTCKFQEESTKCKLPVDFTDQMVGRGLADEEVKRKLLAKPEEKSTLEKTLRFVGPRRAASTTCLTVSSTTPVWPASRPSRSNRGSPISLSSWSRPPNPDSDGCVAPSTCLLALVGPAQHSDVFKSRGHFQERSKYAPTHRGRRGKPKADKPEVDNKNPQDCERAAIAI